MSNSNNNSAQAPGLDWPGLLAWSSKYHDGTAPSNFTKLSAEDRKFIQGAMEAALEHVEDFNDVLIDGLMKLAEAMGEKNPNEGRNFQKEGEKKLSAVAEEEETTVEDSSVSKEVDTADAAEKRPLQATQALIALEVIDRCVDDPDCARNLDKFGGLKVLLKCVQLFDEKAAESEEATESTSSSEDSSNVSVSREVVNKACEILSLMLANNEKAQLAAVREHGALDKLLYKARHENGESKTQSLDRSKLSLIASIVRGHVQLEQEFVDPERHAGFEWLCIPFESLDPESDSASHFSKESRRVREKAALFIRHLLLEQPVRASGAASLLLNKCLLPALRELTRSAEESDSDSDHAGIQYSEIISETAAIVIQAVFASGNASNVGDEATELRGLAKKRMEIILRRADMEMYASEIAGWKGVLGGAAKI